MSWSRFLLALAVVAVPAVLLENSNERWAWRYTALILLVMIVFYWRGLSAFAAFMRRELGG